LFGAPAPVGGFGAAPTGGLFGAPAPAPFGQSLGQQQPQQQQQPLQYGAPQQYQPQPLFAANAQIIPPAADEVLQQRLRALENQRKELEKTEVWKGSPSTGSTSTPTSQYDTSGSFFASSAVRASAMSFTPRSGAKIRPRGFPSSEPTKKPEGLTVSRRDNRGMMSPEASLQSNQLNLVIREGSLQRSRKLGGGLKLDDDRSPALPSESIQPPPRDDDQQENSPAAQASTNGQFRSDPTPPGRPPQSRTSGAALLSQPAGESPGYDYYQQVIGDSTPARSQARTPAFAESPRAAESSVPTLTKEGYQVTPSLEELGTMSEADLASVQNFSVARPGYGKVEWKGAVDVRDADLDRIVIIENKDISVYEKDEAEGVKPDEGAKLNRPAKLTFYNVAHKKGPQATEEEKEAFAKKLEKVTKKMGAEFISYDKSLAEWCIVVSHFSRYGLLTDEDTDDERSAAEEPLVKFQLPPLESTPRQPKQAGLSKKRKATPFRMNRIAWDEQDASQSSADNEDSDSNMVSSGDTDADDVDEIARVLTEASKEPFQSSPQRVSVDVTAVTFEDEGEESEDEERSLIGSESAPTREEIEYATTAMPSICSRLAKDAGVAGSTHIEAGRTMGRSFRVGWLPDGSFLKLTGWPGNGLVVGRPRLSKDAAKSIAPPLLDAQRSCAEV